MSILILERRRSDATMMGAMRIFRGSAYGMAAAALLLGVSAPASAGERGQPLDPPMILQMLSKPMEKPEAVMREMLRADATSVKPVRSEGQVMPDGSVRYGRETAGLTMSIRTPCSPGYIDHEMTAPPSLAGRRQ
jgi:hypothetical protein